MTHRNSHAIDRRALSRTSRVPDDTSKIGNYGGFRCHGIALDRDRLLTPSSSFTTYVLSAAAAPGMVSVDVLSPLPLAVSSIATLGSHPSFLLLLLSPTFQWQQVVMYLRFPCRRPAVSEYPPSRSVFLYGLCVWFCRDVLLVCFTPVIPSVVQSRARGTRRSCFGDLSRTLMRVASSLQMSRI